jgi:anti-anti-sigma factor
MISAAVAIGPGLGCRPLASRGPIVGQIQSSVTDRDHSARRGVLLTAMTEYNYITYKNVDGVAVVNFLETVSMFDGDKVRDVGNELLDLVDSKKYTKLLLNMTNARFVSSAMLAHLVKLHRRVHEAKGKIRLCCLRPVIMDAFRVSNFDKIFEIFPDEAAALKKF